MLTALWALSIPACASLDDTLPIPLSASPKQLPATLNQNPKPASTANSSVVPASFDPAAKAEPVLPSVPAAGMQGTPLPIDLATALTLSKANPLDVQIAAAQVGVASARLQRANVLWLPNVNLGVDYYRHDGQIQDIAGQVFTTSRSSLLLGAGPQLVVSTSDAKYAPLAAKQLLMASQADSRTIQNDTTLAVVTAYFNVQQARGDVAGALESLRRADDLVVRTEKLAPDLTPLVEVNRAKTEAARRRVALESAYERWQVSSAELTRILRLQPGTIVEPAEEPSLTVSLIEPGTPVDELIAIGLTHRPELASQQAIVQAALIRTKQEKYRPYYPVLAARGVGSNTPGLGGVYFGGGRNDDLGNFGARFSMDLQAIWEFQNLGFGNRAMVREAQGDNQRALYQLLRAQDFVISEIVQAHAQVVRSARRIQAAEEGVTNAAATAEKNLQGLGQTKRVGEQLVLVFRPQEVVASISALDQAYRDYYQAVADSNRAQFRLYRALGHPAEQLCKVQQ